MFRVTVTWMSSERVPWGARSVKVLLVGQVPTRQATDTVTVFRLLVESVVPFWLTVMVRAVVFTVTVASRLKRRTAFFASANCYATVYPASSTTAESRMLMRPRVPSAATIPRIARIMSSSTRVNAESGRLTGSTLPSRPTGLG